ncbi:pyruvate dehydrogenase complex dihydrolipoamide acetyltransferase [Micavibrio aeruginosavorus]|uniref:Acetyltransferase component of pyruvate dehydrogenase complex n=1 Tax=Micavibrio aeruginosavorus EPB TaxID=349215 RepID=M4VHU8_9BACT|nr:pyruvate dehydrogenase complex dihydrolipoamide acetyltransferase [Micavibrio aeruginosavorus]AGH98050.1 Dihydrolipoamide acetyltransferase component of pyruvate dehydrogenase complex [Micavibrio aeruginosavorus EPB]
MPIQITMPALSPTMTEGKLAKWTKKEGDKIKAGDVIAEIETDKATMEVEAVDEGTLGKILVADGTEGVAVNTPIAMLLEDGESAADLGKAAAPKAAPMAPSAAPAAAPVAQKAAPVAVQMDKGSRVFASPLARRLAGEKGIDLSAVSGTGPHGRIVKDDVLNFKGGAAKAPASAGASRTASAGPNAKQLADLLGMEYTELPNNNIRKVVASRLLESKQTVPHFYLTIDCRIDDLLAARERLNAEAKGAFKLSVNDFVIKASAMALKAYPAANVSWTDDAILQYHSSDISVAVATPNGLITPIVKSAETKGLRAISEEVKDLAARARDGKLKPVEFQGGTFSISNLGMYGIKDFAAIINPPQACILAVGAGIQQPVVVNGKLEVGTVMSVTLSVDHRAVDGAVGAEYLQVFKRYIENPVSMLV